MGEVTALHVREKSGLNGRDQTISFGPFRLLSSQRLLLKDEKPVPLGGRALDILIALTARAGEPVANDGLIAAVWGRAAVEESNLKVHISALRKALGDGQGGNRYIVNIPRRGYCFVAPVMKGLEDSPSSALTLSQSSGQSNNLPHRLTKVIGRDKITNHLASELASHRLLTIAGSGGIGKTTVAVAVAQKRLGCYRDGVRFVNLGNLQDAALVASEVATALGAEIRSKDAADDVVAALRECDLLLVFDSCERFVEAAAAVAARILDACPNVCILATSREPLRIEGEQVYRLPPLGLPPESADLTAAAALTYPAIQLFCVRAAANLNEFELTDKEAPAVAMICQRLDGIPLAIELAAARVDSFGLQGLADQIERQFQLLSRGWRTSVPRQQTIKAALNWSYDCLTEPSRIVLRRLAIFSGPFTIEAAVKVAADGSLGETGIVNNLSDLVTKSLVLAGVGQSDADYRLIQLTRAFCLEKLIEAGEFDSVSRRHAEYYRDYFESLEVQLGRRHGDDVLAQYRSQINDIRAAVDWALKTKGAESIGVALTAATGPIWMQLSLTAECRTRVEKALGSLGVMPIQGSRLEMQLYAALGMALLNTEGPNLGTRRAWTNVLDIAESLNDTDYQMRALSGLWQYHLWRSQLGAAESFASRFWVLAQSHGDAADLMTNDRMKGILLHYSGNQASARPYVEHMLQYFEAPPMPAHTIGLIGADTVVGHSVLARILWLQGYPDQAIATAEAGERIARSIRHDVSLCFALGTSVCQVAAWSGGLGRAERAVAELLNRSSRDSLRFWNISGCCLKGVLLMQRGKIMEGLQLLQPAMNALREIGNEMHLTSFLGEFAKGLGRIGKIAQGLDAVNEALDLSNKDEARWYQAELLRTKGELLLLEGGSEAQAGAQDQFEKALNLARSQGALSFELRSAMSLFRLKRDKSGGDSAWSLLDSIYRRFSEGFGTADLKQAKDLLGERGSVVPV